VIRIFTLFTLVFIHTASASPALWDTLTSIRPASSKPTPQIKELISKPIELTGFTIIDENKDGEITEFLFTRRPGSCIHDPLPAPNHVVYVKLPKGKSIPAFINQKVIVRGMLSMSSRNDSAYELVAESVTQL
jgi:hypothetical protein